MILRLDQYSKVVSWLKKNYFSLIIKLTLVLLSLFFSYRIVYFIGETYFFDKLFYDKSIAHGYKICNPKCDLDKYGKRSKDIRKIIYTSNSSTPSAQKNILGKKTDDIYRIALIGDSFTWGVGVRENQTFSYILENKLNSIRKTEVLSFSYPGDSVLENLIKYKIVDNLYDVDLYIFVLVDNDLLLNQNNRYVSPIYENILALCEKSETPFIFSQQSIPQSQYYYFLKDSFENKSNLCVLESVSQQYPKQNAIYFRSQWYGSVNDSWNIYNGTLEKEGLFTLSVMEAQNKDKYKKYFQEQGKDLVVSQKDGHPSKLAHQMHADVLFEEIVNNPLWGYKN